jgi:hypothetical protein
MQPPCYRPGHDIHWIQWKKWSGDPASRRGGTLLGVRRGAFIVEFPDGGIVEYECIHAPNERAALAASPAGIPVSVSERWHVLAMPEARHTDGRVTQRIYSIRWADRDNP